MRISDWSSDVCSSDLQAEYQGMYLANTGEQVAGMAASYQTIYHSLFYFIHSIEQLFELLMNKNLEELDAAVLPARYQEVMTAVRALTRVSVRLEQIDTGGDQNKAFSGKLQYVVVFQFVTQDMQRG